MTLANYLIASGLLFAIGLLGVLVRRNIIVMFMCLEMMLSAANLTLVAFSRFNGLKKTESTRGVNHLIGTFLRIEQNLTPRFRARDEILFVENQKPPTPGEAGPISCTLPQSRRGEPPLGPDHLARLVP